MEIIKDKKMTWEEFKKKAENLGYNDCDNMVNKYNSKTGYTLAFYENGEVEIDDFVVVVINDYNKMVLMMQALE